MTLKFDEWPRKTIRHHFYTTSNFVHQFQIHWWIQTGVTVRKCSIRLKIADFLSRVTSKFDGWPWKIIGHIFCTTLSFCTAFQSHWHIQTGVTVRKRSIRVKIGGFFFVCFVFVPGDFENWRMTLKNNRALLLYYVKLCASFQIHTWITARKHSSRVKIGDFLSRGTLKINAWTWKTIGHLSYAASTFVHHFIANDEFKLVRKRPIRVKIDDFLAMWPWNLTDNLEEQ